MTVSTQDLRSASPRRFSPGGGETMGRSLVELLIVLALLALVTGAGGEAMDRLLQRLRVRAASRELAMLFRQARSDAILIRRAVGVAFDASNGYRYAVYEDGNGNGIRTADIRSGVDRRIQAERSIADGHRGVGLRLLSPGPIPVIPPERGSIQDLADPVQFGSSDIVSFSPSGSSSFGTVYLAFGSHLMGAVRVHGTTGRVRLWEYDAAARMWQAR